MIAVVPGWFTDTGTIAATLVAISAALAVGWRAAVKVRRHADNLIETHLLEIRADVNSALLELRPNHSTSLRDAVDRIENAVILMDRRIGRCEDQLVAQSDRNDEGREGKIDRRKPR
jgi:hypothetical protein